MTSIYLSLGSNVSPETNIRAAISALSEKFKDLRLSPVYKSPAMGFQGPAFLNLAIATETTLSPWEVIDILHEIEVSQGRDRIGPKFSDRTLDLDLLLYGNQVLGQGELQIPRSEIEQYAFVLVPLADLAGGQCHPMTGRTFADMRRELQDRDPAQFSSLQKVVFNPS